MNMSGKSVLVTGAASGIGRATAVRLAQHGAVQLACLDVHREGNAETARLVREAGAQAHVIDMDLADTAQICRAYAEAVSACGRLDAAAHIGGYSWRADTLEVTPEQWDKVVNVNLRGTFFCCQEALKVMYAQGVGAIVNMSADAAFHPIHGYAVQAADKGGIAHMTQTMALEAARRGVRVNAVSPGITWVRPTGAPRADEPPLRRDATVPPALADISKLGEQTAAGRFLRPEEIADVFVFLCSDAASAVSGSLLHANAGGYLTLQF